LGNPSYWRLFGAQVATRLNGKIRVAREVAHALNGGDLTEEEVAHEKRSRQARPTEGFRTSDRLG